MLSLPLPASPIRDMFDVEDLAYRRFVTLADAKASAKRACWDGVRSMAFLVLRADDRVQLISIGPRGGRKVLWNFGKAAG